MNLAEGTRGQLQQDLFLQQWKQYMRVRHLHLLMLRLAQSMYTA